MNVVIIEDEHDLLELLEFTLAKEGYHVKGFLEGKSFLSYIQDNNVSLLLVDRNLPGMDGLEIVKQIRAMGFLTPVIFLTAKNSDKDVLEGFEIGADDYITKPFLMKELLFRIKAVLNRSYNLEKPLRYRNIVVSPKKREVYIDSELIELTKKEFDILYLFITHNDQVLSREEIIENVWGNTTEKNVNVAMTRLKGKIGDIICSVRGIGYKLC